MLKGIPGRIELGNGSTRTEVARTLECPSCLLQLPPHQSQTCFFLVVFSFFIMLFKRFIYLRERTRENEKRESKSSAEGQREGEKENPSRLAAEDQVLCGA